MPTEDEKNQRPVKYNDIINNEIILLDILDKISALELRVTALESN